MSKFIKPTVGRVVLLMVGLAALPGFAKPATGEPCAALVTRVWGDRCINVAAFDANGACFGFTSVRLLQEDDVAGEGEMHAKWMDYQLGQAAKAEQLEAKLASAPVLAAEAAIEAEIQAKGLDAPRLKPEDIDRVIVGETFTILPSGKVMVCELTLRNGFTVRGESACVSKANFNEEIGRKISRDNARNKVWELEGYLLQERVASAPKASHDPQELAPECVEAIARAAHEVNRAYCAALGDDSQPAWEGAPEWQRSSAINGVRFHLANPDAGPDHSHVEWLKEKEATGWKWGPVKDAEKKEHPCFVPYADLPVEQKAKDYLFRGVVHALS